MNSELPASSLRFSIKPLPDAHATIDTTGPATEANGPTAESRSAPAIRSEWVRRSEPQLYAIRQFLPRHRRQNHPSTRLPVHHPPLPRSSIPNPIITLLRLPKRSPRTDASESGRDTITTNVHTNQTKQSGLNRENSDFFKEIYLHVAHKISWTVRRKRLYLSYK